VVQKYKLMKPNKTMLLVSGTWDGKETFRLLPVSVECPFNEVIYAAGQNTLAIVGKEKKQAFQMVPKLTAAGDPELAKKPRANGGRISEERKTIDAYYEYYIVNPEEIEEFIGLFAINAGTFDWKKYIQTPAPTDLAMAA
jgi:hypothetical protein